MTTCDDIVKGCGRDLNNNKHIYTCGTNNWHCPLCKAQAQTASKILNEELEWIKIFNEYTLLGTDPISKNVAEKRIAFIQSELDKLKAML